MPTRKTDPHRVTRAWNIWGSRDYLCEWDIIWGPVWSSSREKAIVFDNPKAALEAMNTAEAITAPRLWCVPDLGQSRLHIEPV
jgi:hypothetical protein